MSQWCIDGKEMYKVERCKWKFVVVNKTRLLFCRFFFAVAVVVGFVVIQK